MSRVSGGDAGRGPNIPVRIRTSHVWHVSTQDREKHVSHVPRRVHRPGSGHGETGRGAAEIRSEVVSVLQNLQPFKRVNKGPPILDIERDIDPGRDDWVHPGQGIARHVSLK